MTSQIRPQIEYSISTANETVFLHSNLMKNLASSKVVQYDSMIVRERLIFGPSCIHPPQKHSGLAQSRTTTGSRRRHWLRNSCEEHRFKLSAQSK